MGSTVVERLSKVTRVEIIDHRTGGQGLVYVTWDSGMAVDAALQDDGRTLKIFLMNREKAAP